MGQKNEAAKLRRAMKRVGESRGVDFYEKFCEMALEDSRAMIAIMKKVVPDMKQVEVEGNMTVGCKVIEVPCSVPVGTPVGEKQAEGGAPTPSTSSGTACSTARQKPEGRRERLRSRQKAEEEKIKK